MKLLSLILLLALACGSAACTRKRVLVVEPYAGTAQDSVWVRR